MNTKVAVIVPVYNTERYLAACLDSIIKQTYTNFIAFAVDDGSTDKSGAILEDFAKRDARIRVIRKANGGVSSARNAGLAAIEMDPDVHYVAMIDSDDRISPAFLHTLVHHAASADADYVACASQSFDRNGLRPLPVHIPPVTLLNQEDIAAQFFSNSTSAHGPHDPALFRKLCFMRRSALEGLRFDEKLRCVEDQFFFLEMLPRLNRGLLTPEPLYQYRLRASSLSHSSGGSLYNLLTYEKLFFSDQPLPAPAKEGLRDLMIDGWWQQTRRLYESSNTSFSDRLELQQFFERIEKAGLLTSRDRRLQRRLRIYRLGDWALRLYFKLRTNRSQTVSVKTAAYFD